MEERASQVHGESGERKARRWTDTYEQWENWQVRLPHVAVDWNYLCGNRYAV